MRDNMGNQLSSTWRIQLSSRARLLKVFDSLRVYTAKPVSLSSARVASARIVFVPILAYITHPSILQRAVTARVAAWETLVYAAFPKAVNILPQFGRARWLLAHMI